ncbi:MAG: hypothetical protein HHJ12_09955 [Glaciimonas sp.]|nr:hypothetical protein [Glaciimonas sp.]NMM38777.1 hypothetical protein [Glaciimonas sp.]
MNNSLTKDEFDALGQVSKMPKFTKANACVARNTKRLAGLKYLVHGKDGSLTLTEKGQKTLFAQRCIDALRAVSTDPLARLEADVVTFLSKKGYINPGLESRAFDITPRGQECLADIEATGG